MKIRNFIYLIILTLTVSVITVNAQTNTVVGQVSASTSPSFTGGMSGDGRLIVFESTGNLATENPRNSDRNREIFVFDYAQRRIFQITDTVTAADNPVFPASSQNAKVFIDNTRPVISNDGKWIAFTSNATTSISGSPVDGSNPGNFDGSSLTNTTSGGDTIDLSEADGGETIQNIIQPASPTIVNIRITDLNAGISGFGVTVAGTNTSGGAITETFTFENGLNQFGTQVFATVTSVTLDSVAGNGQSDRLNLYYGDATNPLSNDANLEMWLFEFQNALTPVDLSQGTEIPVTDLSAGTFTQITNTQASRLPRRGTFSQPPLVASDNTTPSISDNGSVVAFVSNRNLVGTGNQAPDDNAEIFTFVRPTNSTSQVTKTIRGAIFEPRYNNSPTISGNGSRVMFVSNANNPIVGMTGGDNTDISEEIFYSDLDLSGIPAGVKKQVTTTTPDTPGVVVNLVNDGQRMSRDGKYIAFDSFADLTNENSGENQVEFGTFVYNADTDSFSRIGERSNADADAPGGDIARYPTFTDYVGTTPQTLVLETRMNITADGTIAEEGEDGLNDILERPSQVYSYPLNVASGSETFNRLTLFPPPPFLLASIKIHPSNSSKRMALTIPSSEIGTGNIDFSTEVYYLLTPEVTSEPEADLTFFTGATKIPVSNDPVPTPSPTPTPSPEPTPETPVAVQGLSAGSLGFVNYDVGATLPATTITAVGSFDRRFNLPMELGGVTMTINGISVGMKSVSQTQIEFVVPDGLGANLDVPFDVVINNNGTEIKGELILVPARPDIFVFEDNPAANRAKILNITNRVQTREPFDVLTLRYRGGIKVRTELRLFVTGIRNASNVQLSIRIGDEIVTNEITGAIPFAPGVYTVDFRLQPNLEMAGDQPIIITVTVDEVEYVGRLDGDAPRVRIL